jgi:hypothetical protein
MKRKEEKNIYLAFVRDDWIYWHPRWMVGVNPEKIKA